MEEEVLDEEKCPWTFIGRWNWGNGGKGIEGNIPVLGIATRDNDFDDDLVGLWLGDRHVLDGD